MKAAILYQSGTIPQYGEISDPVSKDGEQIIQVKAASIKNLDKMRASGAHYDSYQSFPAIAGVDGVGVLPEGTRVYAGSPTGMMAEKAVISSKWMVPVPDELDDVTAAALPNPGVSAWLTLTYKGQLQKGGAVLIMGATGTTGMLAVQLAKYLGAGKVIVMGRNPDKLAGLLTLGADAFIALNQPEDTIRQQLKAHIAQQPFDIIIDYLWGKPAEIVLDVLTGHDLNAIPHLTKYIQVGEMAGSHINFPAASLRSSLIEVSGVGGGSIPKEIMMTIPQIIAQLFQLSVQGNLRINTKAMPLKDVAAAWQHTEPNGERIVLIV